MVVLAQSAQSDVLLSQMNRRGIELAMNAVRKAISDLRALYSTRTSLTSLIHEMLHELLRQKRR